MRDAPRPVGPVGGVTPEQVGDVGAEGERSDLGVNNQKGSMGETVRSGLMYPPAAEHTALTILCLP